MIYIVLLFVLFLVGIPIWLFPGPGVDLRHGAGSDADDRRDSETVYRGRTARRSSPSPSLSWPAASWCRAAFPTGLSALRTPWIGHFPSGLALVSILACMFFAAITGSAIAATAAIGGIMIPIMREKNYEDTFSAPLIACGGSIGPIIPPSIPLLLYGTMANVSVGKLFIGGFIPGIIMGVGLMIYSYFVGKNVTTWEERRRPAGRRSCAPARTRCWR